MEPLESPLSEKTTRWQLAANPIADEIVRWSKSQTSTSLDAKWLLEIRGEILDLTDSWKNREMLIKAHLSTTVWNQGNYWLGRVSSWEEDEATHPLRPFSMLNIREDDCLLDLWREKRSKILVLTILYNFLLGDDEQIANCMFEKNFDDTVISIPQRWVRYLAMSRLPMHESAILYTSRSLGVDIIREYTAADTEQQLSPLLSQVSVSIADLCISPMTPELVASLLMHLKVLEQTAPPYNLLNGMKGLKGRGLNRISKTVAAFQVLSEDGFFDSNRSAWPLAALADYGLPIGDKALGYRYQGIPGVDGSPSYDKAAESTCAWISRQEQLNTDL